VAWIRHWIHPSSPKVLVQHPLNRALEFAPTLLNVSSLDFLGLGLPAAPARGPLLCSRSISRALLADARVAFRISTLASQQVFARACSCWASRTALQLASV
jgi:hypothetical protein